MVIPVITMSFLAGMFYTDLKSRLIPIWMYLGLIIAMIVRAASLYDTSLLAINTGVNILSIMFLLGGVHLYYWMKNRRLIKILDQYFGAGDLLFLLISAIYFSPLMFIVFQVLSIMLLLLIFGLYILVSGNRNTTIPLAGGQAILVLCFELLSVLGIHSWQYRDDLMAELIFSLFL